MIEMLLKYALISLGVLVVLALCCGEIIIDWFSNVEERFGSGTEIGR
jgi:flagellar basal body-associated protein FliL